MLRLALIGILVALASAPVACAEPGAPPGSGSCTADLEGAMTRMPDADGPSVCRGGAWQPVTTPQPPADRWVSFGSPLKLHGQGMRNPDMVSGKWTATPQNSAAQCRVQQQEVVIPGQLSAPATAVGEPGQRLQFEVPPRMFLIELSGDCLWERR
ncbi:MULTISPECIES: hypothetical protein [unclassified Mycobacterium]|uniref:hypothetical protein n=1 Tax=unclassified Mycobacterium TaxID=2642494 RepID=UPI00074010FB|nr:MULTISPECIES: hypothetical protein [unclassified Mycobacterium]KUH80504.1 hypothetical protein AU186_14015 [Mycobacterium sp. GA-1999]KUH89194.1 hypothetical protein AU185_24335 [Mycobacterium sp. GA-0227b]KUH95929.1 hypothetical protein AU187_21070 [Mycobacterium sp. IS-1556]